MRRPLKPVAVAGLLALALLGGCGPAVSTVNSSDRVGAPAVTLPEEVEVGDAGEVGDLEIGHLESALEELEDYLDEVEAQLEADLPMAP